MGPSTRERVGRNTVALETKTTRAGAIENKEATVGRLDSRGYRGGWGGAANMA